MNDYYYDKNKKTMFVYKTITVKEFLKLKGIYKKVEVRGGKKEVRWKIL